MSSFFTTIASVPAAWGFLFAERLSWSDDHTTGSFKLDAKYSKGLKKAEPESMRKLARVFEDIFRFNQTVNSIESCQFTPNKDSDDEFECKFRVMEHNKKTAKKHAENKTLGLSEYNDGDKVNWPEGKFYGTRGRFSRSFARKESYPDWR